jgi:hypothetical protein
MKACTANEPLACCEYCAFNPRNITARRQLWVRQGLSIKAKEKEEWFEPNVTHFCPDFRIEENGSEN